MTAEQKQIVILLIVCFGAVLGGLVGVLAWLDLRARRKAIRDLDERWESKQ